MSGGVGTKLITAYDQPALGAVYKIVAIEDENGELRNTIKLSNNAEKVSTPGKKQVWRITSREKGSLRETTLPMTALMSMAWKSWKCSIQPIPTSIKLSKILMPYRFWWTFSKRGIWSIISRA